MAAGTVLHRVHRIRHDPIFFGPGTGAEPGRLPESRFDSVTGRFGVLYLGGTREAAVVETLLRNPRRRLVSARRIAERALSEVVLLKAVVLVSLMDAGLQQLGIDNSITTGPYEPCGLWADALHDHPSEPDGLVYRSRHDPSQICFALFEGAEPRVAKGGAAVPLLREANLVAAILDRYHRGIDLGDG